MALAGWKWVVQAGSQGGSSVGARGRRGRPQDRWRPGWGALVALGWGCQPGRATCCRPVGGSVDGQFLRVPGASCLSLPPSPLLCVYTCSYMQGPVGLCCFAFVITLHTYLELIELISDNAVCSLPAGWISFPSARSVRPAWELGAGLLAFGVTAGRDSLRRAGHPRLSALHSRGCLVPREVSRVADAEHAQEGRNWGRL